MFDNVRRVFKQSAVYGSGEAAVFAVNFLLLPIYTRILAPADYGALSMLLLLQAFLAPLNRLGLDEAYLRFYYDCENDDQKRTLTGTTGIFLGAANLCVLVGLLLGAPAVGALLLIPDHLGAVRLLALNGFITAFFVLPQGLMRARNRPGQYARWMIVRAIGIVAVRLLLVVGLRMGVLGMILAEVIVSAILFVGLTRVVRGLLAWRFSWPLLRELLRYGFPRTPYALLYQTMGMSERYFLLRYLSAGSLGTYHVAANIVSALRIYQDAVLRAWMPFAFETMRRPDAPRVLARLATVAFAGLVLATLALAVFAEPLIVLMTDPAFHGARAVAPLLAIGVAVQIVRRLPDDVAQHRQGNACAPAHRGARRGGHRRRQPGLHPAVRAHRRRARGGQRSVDPGHRDGRRRAASLPHPVRAVAAGPRGARRRRTLRRLDHSCRPPAC